MSEPVERDPLTSVSWARVLPATKTPKYVCFCCVGTPGLELLVPLACPTASRFLFHPRARLFFSGHAGATPSARWIIVESSCLVVFVAVPCTTTRCFTMWVRSATPPPFFQYLHPQRTSRLLFRRLHSAVHYSVPYCFVNCSPGVHSDLAPLNWAQVAVSGAGDVAVVFLWPPARRVCLFPTPCNCISTFFREISSKKPSCWPLDVLRPTTVPLAASSSMWLCS
jgi:hypothetical protein